MWSFAMRPSLPAFCAAALLAASDAHAGTVGYDAAFFAAYRPQTALDMVARTPGFTLQDGNDRRGFAGALGNVLIDGERPIVKDQSLEDMLKTIPAAQVLRVEVRTGDAVAGDPSGESVLLDIVRVRSAGSGYAAIGAETANRGRAMPDGQLSWTGRTGVTDYSLGLESYGFVRNLPAIYRLTDADGGAMGTSRERSPRGYYEFKLNSQMSRPLLGGQLSATLQGHYSRYHEDTLRDDFAPDGAFTGGQATPYTETTASYALGGQYQRDLGPWRTDLTAFASGKHFFSDVFARPFVASGRVTSATHQALDRHSGEGLVRAVIARGLGRGRLEIGGDAARNTMDAALVLTYAAGGSVVPIAVPDSNSHIVEDRTEIHIGYVRDLASDLGLDLRLAREQSDLHFRGDTNESLSYAFVKPSMTLTRRLGTGNQLSLHIYRDADQIDFNNFLSAESLKDSVLNGGNPELKPQTSWRTELSGDWHFGPRTAANLKLYHAALSDTADLVPVSKGGVTYAAPGNIGPGRIDGLTAGLTLPLDKVMTGASLTLSLMGQTSAVTDPVTGRKRPLSNLQTWTASLAFRQDLPARDLAWGIDGSGGSATPQYLLSEADSTPPTTGPTFDAYVERSRLGPFTLRLALTDGLATARRRVFYRPDRRGPLAEVNVETQKPGQWANVTLSRSF
jgi:hypothetical protein